MALTGSRLIRVPAYMTNLKAKMGKITPILESRLKRKPTLEDLSEELEIPEKNLKRVTDITDSTRVFNVQTETPEGNPMEAIEDRTDDREPEFNESVLLVWNTLKEMEREEALILLLRFDFLQDNPELVEKVKEQLSFDFEVKQKRYTCNEVGKIFGISREKARTREKAALDSFQLIYQRLQKERG